MEHPRSLGRWAFALIGVLAAVAGMAVGHVVAGIVLPAASPVLAVGSAVIDATPRWLKDWAIEQFGTGDKAVLVGSVVVVTLLIAVVAGILSRRRPAIGLAFVGLLGTVVVAAALTVPAVASADPTFPGATVLPGITAAIAAAIVLLQLRTLALGPAVEVSVGERLRHTAELQPEPAPEVSGGERLRHTAELHPEPAQPIESPTDHSAIGQPPVGETPRRRFLAGAAGVAAGSAVLGAIGQRFAAPDPVRELGDLTLASTEDPLPASLDAEVAGITPLRTADSDFYRIDTALVVPRIDRSSWRLKIDGDVDEPLELNFDELVAMPLIERDITLNCVSNEVGGPYISSGRWIGVRTRDLLERVGVRSGVDQILSRSSDGMTISTPLQALTDDRDSMIAVGLNGEALSRPRGYPARLLTPGLYGYVGATKWLTSLTATTFAADAAYWTQRGWAETADVKTQSRIDVPRSFADVAVGKVTVGGVAWAQGRGIDRVEVQVDDGPWTDAELGSEVNIDYWRQWYAVVELATPGRHTLRVRATDGDGVVQTEERARPFPDGASGLHSVAVTAE